MTNSGISARSHSATSWSGGALAVGHDQHRRLQRDDARDAARCTSRVGVLEVGDLALAHHLHAVRVDVVQVADQVGAPSAPRAPRPRRSGAPDGAWPATHSQRSARLVLLEQRLRADDGGFQVGA